MSIKKHSVEDTSSSDSKATRLRSLDEDLPELRPYLNSGTKVLDIGCAFGTMSLDVADSVNPGVALKGGTAINFFVRDLPRYERSRSREAGCP